MSPFVQAEVQEGLLPEKGEMTYRFGCHSTSGGTLRSVYQEVSAFEMKETPDVVVISVGANNVGNKHTPGQKTR